MESLKPDTPCWLREIPKPLEAWNGRPVSVVRLLPYDRCEHGHDHYAVKASWYPAEMVTCRSMLVPMTGPRAEDDVRLESLIPDKEAA